MAGSSRIMMSHVGICVSDIEASARFYCGVFDLERRGQYLSGEETSRLVGIDPPLQYSSLFLAGDEISIELISFTHPGFLGSDGLRPMNLSGITHLSFRVPSIETVGGRIGEFGGKVLSDTRFQFGEVGAVIFCTDPDGTRLELMELDDAFAF